MVAYAHRPQPQHEDLAVDAVAITDDVSWRPIPTAGLDQLTSNPFRGRVSGCSKGHDLPPAVTQDQQTVEPERDRRDHEQIHRRDAVSMITKKGPPALGRRSPPSRHVFCNGCLADLDSKLEEFSVDPRCAPQWVGDAHVPNELTNISPVASRMTWTALPITSRGRRSPFGPRGIGYLLTVRGTGCRSSPIEWRITKAAPCRASPAIMAATMISGHPVPVPNTPTAASRTARLPSTSFRLQIHADRM